MGKSKFSSVSDQLPNQAAHLTSNKFDPLIETDKQLGDEDSQQDNACHDNFSIPIRERHSQKKQRMPQLPTFKSQNMRNTYSKPSCDVDKMSVGDCGAAIADFGNCHGRGCCQNQSFPSASESDHNKDISTTPVPSQPVAEVNPKDKSGESEETNNPYEHCYDKGKVLWMATSMMANLEDTGLEVSETVRNFANVEINLITSMQPSADVLNVEVMAWVQVPCVVDRGVCVCKSGAGECIQTTRCHHTQARPKVFWSRWLAQCEPGFAGC